MYDVTKFLGVLLSLVILTSCSSDDNETTIDDNTPIIPSALFQDKFIICHRGHGDYPENTMTAIKAAISVGFRAVECDIEINLDGVPVLSHDKTIERCSNGGAEFLI